MINAVNLFKIIDMTTLVKIQEIKALIKHRMNGEVAENMRLAGIVYKVNYGVSIPELREIAQQYVGDHDLALELFKEDIRECKIIASLIDDPAKVTGEQIDSWSEDFDNPEIVEQACSNLIWKSKYALSRSIEWCISGNELLRKAGMLIIGRNASDESLNDKIFEPYVDIFGNMADEVTDVYQSAMLYALRGIAKRNDGLRQKVVELCNSMSESENELAAWIANELLYEFVES